MIIEGLARALKADEGSCLEGERTKGRINDGARGLNPSIASSRHARRSGGVDKGFEWKKVFRLVMGFMFKLERNAVVVSSSEELPIMGGTEDVGELLLMGTNPVCRWQGSYGPVKTFASDLLLLHEDEHASEKTL